MDVIDLAPGQKAQPTEDRITVARTPSGRFEVRGALATAGAMIVQPGGPITFETADEAKGAGVDWAEGHNVPTLYVEWPDA